jgi:hypothetical protein
MKKSLAPSAAPASDGAGAAHKKKKQKWARKSEAANLMDGLPVFNPNAPKRAVTAVGTDLKSNREKVAADRAAGGGGEGPTNIILPNKSLTINQIQ